MAPPCEWWCCCGMTGACPCAGLSSAALPGAARRSHWTMSACPRGNSPTAAFAAAQSPGEWTMLPLAVSGVCVSGALGACASRADSDPDASEPCAAAGRPNAQPRESVSSDGAANKNLQRNRWRFAMRMNFSQSKTYTATEACGPPRLAAGGTKFRTHLGCKCSGDGWLDHLCSVRVNKRSA